MTIAKLGHTPAPAQPFASAPSVVRGLLAMFGGGAARRAAEAAVDVRETAPTPRLPPAPSSSVARRPGGASDPRLSLLGAPEDLRPRTPREVEAKSPVVTPSVAEQTKLLDAAADDAVVQRAKREAALASMLPELHRAGVVVELADYVRAYARAKGGSVYGDSKLGIELGLLDLTAEDPPPVRLFVTADGLRAHAERTDRLANETEAWAPTAAQLARGGWSVAMIESAVRSAVREIEAGSTPKTRIVRVSREDQLMTNGLRAAADKAAIAKALDAACRAPLRARGHAVAKVIGESLKGLSPGETMQVGAQMLRQIAATTRQAEPRYGLRASDMRTHFFPQEFQMIQSAISHAFTQYGARVLGNEFGIRDADAELCRAMSQRTDDTPYENFGPDGAKFAHWWPRGTFA